ncbi:MAG TPA: oxidoreductase, partial [Myxococcaceae bacterium]|nr:oxidoreductase [Myxococcaceae bacterium]
MREVVWESPDTATLCLEPSPEAPVYRAGQFLTIDPGQFPQLAALKGYLEHAKGHKELVRAYSVAS